MSGASIEWPALAALIIAGGFLLTVVGVATTWAMRVSKGESAAESAKKAHERIDALSHNVGEFKAHVASNYATNSAVEQVVGRVEAAINRLGDRLDRAFERFGKE